MKYTLENINEFTLKYNSKTEFQRKAPGAYKFAVRNNILDKLFTSKIILWNKEKVIEVAKKYKNRSAFAIGDSSAYQYAINNNILDEICVNMKGNTKWTIDLCKKEAIKYSSRKDFQHGSGSAYQYAKKNNILPEIIFKNKRFYWSKETVLQEAKKFKHRSEFYKTNPSAYQYAYKNKILDEVCSHMIKPDILPVSRKTYKDRKTVVYYLKVNNRYKIGICMMQKYKTEKEAILKGRYSKDIRNGLNIEIINYKLFQDGAIAWDIEKIILKKYKKLRSLNEKILISGNTELFNEDISKEISNYFK